MSYVLEAISITKRFPGVLANDNICLNVKPGEVLGLIGENGAGEIHVAQGAQRDLSLRRLHGRTQAER